MKCDKCRLGQTAKNIVWGEGRKEQPLLFIIGEAPGKSEDETGRPFVGGSGNILRGALYKLKINPNDCYITNICKCRPPENRQPKDDEIASCIEYLKSEIEQIKPKKVLLLGETALKFIGREKITKNRGIIFSIEGMQILATFHPSYIMRKREHYPIFVNDILKLHSYVETLTAEPTYIFNPSLEILRDYLFSEPDKWIAIDIETVGDKSEKYPNPFKDEIIGISFSKMSDIRAVQLNRVKLQNFAYIEVIKEFLQTSLNQVYQNNLFDRYFLQVKGIKVKTPVWDTQTAMHIINSNMPKSLDFLRSIYTNEESYKSKENYASRLDWLNAKDTDITLQVAMKQRASMDLKQRELVAMFLRYDDVVLHLKVNGLKVDVERLNEHYARIKPEEDKIFNEFAEMGVNLNSPKQLAKFLFDELKLKPKKFNESGPSTDEEALLSLDQDNEWVKKILHYRELKTISSKYCEGILSLIQFDGRIHPEWSPLGTDTGRWACKKPNIQNFPKEMRDIIIPDSSNHLFIGADYNRIELYVAAILSQDIELLSILENNEDVHQKALEAIEEVYPLTEKVGKDQARRQAKTVVFGTLYGRTPASIAKEYKVSVEIAKQWQNAFYGRFRRLRKYLEEDVIEFWKKHGYVETPFGFRKYTDQLPQAKNHIIQGTAAEIMKRAGLKLFENGFDVRISVHDQWVCQVEKDKAEDKFKEFIKIMETAVPELYNRFPVEGGIGKNWKEV